MCAMMNGITLHGGLIPYGGTFLVFSDYARNALRLAALMGMRAIYVFTHDSIGLGEDGPTHQPIEHAATLRLIPNMDVWRPCDTVETALAWAAALRRKNGPTALLLTRQNVAFQKREIPRHGIAGAATCCPTPPAPGRSSSPPAPKSASRSRRKSSSRRPGCRCGWFPCPRPAFSTARTRITGTRSCRAALPKVAVEAGVSDYWRKYVGLEGAVVGIDRFGESAPAGDLFKHFGFTPENVAKVVRSICQMIKVAINGFGRIGRMVLRAHYEGGKKHAAAVRRDQRPGRRADQRAPAEVRHRPRALSRRGASRRQTASWSTTIASRSWPSAIRPSCRGRRSASTWCWSAPASSPARPRPARTCRPARRR